MIFILLIDNWMKSSSIRFYHQDGILPKTILFQAPRAEVVLVLSRSRSVTPADRGNYDLIEAGYNYINSSRPPKILESPLDSKSLMAGWFVFVDIET